jgi:hypothetical protein
MFSCFSCILIFVTEDVATSPQTNLFLRIMPEKTNRTPLTVQQILRWAKAHRRRTGRWPRILSGPLDDAPGENWRAIDMALRYGNRGLAAGESLPQLLRRHEAEQQRLSRRRMVS